MKTTVLTLLLLSGALALSFTFGRYQQPAGAKNTHITDKKDPGYNPYYIIIDKSDYEMQIFDDTGWLATYPVVFGSKDLGDKMMEGDKRTPTGEFKVLLKKTNKRWGLELLLDYPNTECRKRFADRKKKGLIPKNARIGDGIAIHGTRPESEWAVDNYINWTDGCISVRHSEMKEIYELIPQGTKVTIQQ
jgi:murein L,D-transpeptidase YafK